MTSENVKVTAELHEYILSVSVREPEVLRRLREETSKLPHSSMQIAPEQGRFMELLARLVPTTNALEIGVYTGYSSICIARAMPDNGILIACDISKEWTDMAEPYWDEAGVAHKIDLRLAPAIDTLNELKREGKLDFFDFAFIDADKENYPAYYDLCMEMVRPGGLIVIDNTLWYGTVVDPHDQDTDTVAIRAFNEKVYADERVDLSLLPMADGITLARRRF